MTEMNERLTRIGTHDFVRKTPSAQWVDGMMLGNGDIGAMSWGPPTLRTLTINKSDVWDYRTPGGRSVTPAASLEAIRRMVAEGDKEALLTLAEQSTAGGASAFPTIQPCATARIEIAPGTQTWHYEERLSMATAELTSTYSPFDRLWARPGGIRETTFACATRPVLAMQVRFDDGKPHRHRVTLLRNENPYLPAPLGGADKEMIWLVMTFPDGLISLTAAVCSGASMDTTALADQAVARVRSGAMPEAEFQETLLTFPGTGGALKALTPDEPCTFELYLTAVRGYGDVDALLAEARANLRAAVAAGFEELQREHREWWRDFWSRAYLEIDRPAAERLWFLGLYTLGSCSRQGCQAAGLQGVWSNQDGPPWNSDYHNDVNIQANYWSCHASDHIEQAEPFFRLYEHMAPQARRDAAAYYGSTGMKFPMAGGPDGHELTGHYTCDLWPGGTAWLLLHFWWHYRYTLDREWLRAHAWPLFVDALQFYDDTLLPDGKGGRKVFPSYSPEQIGNRPESLGTNSTADLALIKALLRVGIEAAGVLDVDDPRVAKWRSMLQALPPYPTIPRPYSIRGEWSVRFKDLEERDFDFHTAHLPLTLSPVYPCGEISAWTGNEELRKTALATFDRWRERTGKRPMGGFAGELGGYVQARLGLRQALDDLETVARGHLKSNAAGAFQGFFGDPATPSRFMQIDWILGFPGPLMECLLQSHDDIIRVFPAVPDAFSGSFEGFRAEGQRRVSARMRDGTVCRVEIESLADGCCRVANPWPRARLCVNQAPATENADPILCVELAANDRLCLEPAM